MPRKVTRCKVTPWIVLCRRFIHSCFAQRQTTSLFRPSHFTHASDPLTKPFFLPPRKPKIPTAVAGVSLPLSSLWCQYLLCTSDTPTQTGTDSVPFMLCRPGILCSSFQPQHRPFTSQPLPEPERLHLCAGPLSGPQHPGSSAAGPPGMRVSFGELPIDKMLLTEYF